MTRADPNSWLPSSHRSSRSRTPCAAPGFGFRIGAAACPSLPSSSASLAPAGQPSAERRHGACFGAWWARVIGSVPSMDPDSPSHLRSGVTIIIPALNEEGNLAAAVARCRSVVTQHFADHELIIVNDGSTDATGVVAERCAAADPRVRVVHHARPRNLGFAYKAGVALARFEYVLMFPGDNEGSEAQLHAVLSRAGAADIVINYITNPEIRSRGRRALSTLFVSMMNALSGVRLRYYNGTVLHRTALVRSVTIRTDSFAYQAELLVTLLRAGHTYVEVGTPIGRRVGGRSKAFRLRNLLEVGRALLRLAGEARQR
jgi:voltage-gated potassium channel Kch